MSDDTTSDDKANRGEVTTDANTTPTTHANTNPVTSVTSDAGADAGNEPEAEKDDPSCGDEG